MRMCLVSLSLREKEMEHAVLITGAAGGLGRALVAMALTLPGQPKVVAVDVREEVVGLFSGQGRVLPLVADATSEEALLAARDELHRRRWQVRYLINNAGVYFFHPVTEMTADLLERMMGVNTRAAVLTVSVFLDDLIARRGRVVQVSTCGVRLPTLFQAYPATKIAMEAFSISMRQELALVGVTLSLVRAGAIDTPLVQEMTRLPVPPEESRYAGYYRRFLEQATRRVGRMIPPERMAAVIRRALTDRRPRRLYTVNRNPTIRWLSLLPQTWLDKLMQRMVR